MFNHDTLRSNIKEKGLKKATNLMLSTEVLAEAKKLGINIPKACDAFLESLVRQEKERLWKLENAKFISEYNQITEEEEEGLPLDKWRAF
ncbi:type II toxin-antitoxin system CcdA family antitoxin [Polynucleobacter sp. AP-Reno-20A-A9]|uniref:type II toxin-antitoxin system CcdA family antitoxin n=1 Tax=Polynucleobacter sp. AP-Reno-20A-A9 TaxID=2576925 RepID=UPI001C0B6573|nr:type II toxin-antitoxin system CcdA family antitoxin [Polynucleobacter sp. AP-Reno-20A-A9]MBU3629162.1 type II toxin-antitoxin system CcdA family antitoxin [Polynucleobacter sp. AP-Reno-20A-A9]